MAWEEIEARRLREFVWGRVVLAAIGLSLIGAVMVAAGEGSATAVALVCLGGTVGWFLLLSVYCAVELRREGLIVFPAPWWRGR